MAVMHSSASSSALQAASTTAPELSASSRRNLRYRLYLVVPQRKMPEHRNSGRADGAQAFWGARESNMLADHDACRLDSRAHVDETKKRRPEAGMYGPYLGEGKGAGCDQVMVRPLPRVGAGQATQRRRGVEDDVERCFRLREWGVHIHIPTCLHCTCCSPVRSNVSLSFTCT
jgi:hypothetical protein